MKRSALIFALLLQPFLFLNSCRNDKSQPLCGDPIPTSLQIYLVDKNDSLLIGRKYDPDSIRLTVKNENIDIQISQGRIYFSYPDLVEFNSMNYLISLSKNDIDTINLTVYHNYVEDCGDNYGVGSLSYNSKPIEPITGLVYKIVKN